MPFTPIRLTLINNAKQTQRSGVLLKLDENSDAIAELLTLARNKLRLKKAKTLYLAQGIEITDKAWFLDGRITQDSLVFVSCGEAYIGQVTASSSALAAATKEGREGETSKDKVGETLANAASTMLSLKEKNGTTEPPVVVTVLAKKSFVDPEAEAQLQRVSRLPGMRRVVGQPDLHPGQATPVGATFITEKIIYPALIGNDIGCGMSVYKTRLSSSIRPQKIVDRLVGLEGPWTDGDPQQFLLDYLSKNKPTAVSDKTLTASAAFAKPHLDQLGTLGGGNHFAEFVVIDSIVDAELCKTLDISDDKTYLIVHTGSRKYGQTVLDSTRASISSVRSGKHTTSSSAASTALGIDTDSKAAQEYLAQHDLACQWARANRALVAQRVLTCLNAEQDAVQLLDIWHNHVERKEVVLPPENDATDSDNGPNQPHDDHQQHQRATTMWIHRKGAAPSDRGLVVIPGSRGHYSYLVMPHSSQQQADAAAHDGLQNGFSLAHGAGRQLPRAKALQKQPVASSRQASIAALQTTDLGSMVVCEDSDLLLEEQPAAYKDIYDVIHDLLPFAKIVAILRPIATYKMRNEKNRSS
ncbi:hypothetical protein BGW41_004508 [Actinomortierella wolfii]|nr:hypothetical protein BGW41_004508 [Actinomortierella wolfii]